MAKNINELILKCREEVEEYNKKYFPIFEKVCEGEKNKYSLVFASLLQLYFISSFLIDKKGLQNKRKTRNRHYESFNMLYCKSSQSLLAMEKCLEYGCVSDAAIILRSIFESYITTKILSQGKTYGRVKLYWNYGFVDKYNNYIDNCKLLRNGLISSDDFNKLYDKKTIRSIKKTYNRVKKDYLYTTNKGKNRISYKWYCKLYGNVSLKAICELSEIKEEVNYIKVYGPLSLSVHSSVLIENLLTQKKAYTLSPNYSDTLISLAYLALNYHISTIELILNALKLRGRKDWMFFLNSFLLGVYQQTEIMNNYNYYSRFVSILSDLNSSVSIFPSFVFDPLYVK